MAIPNVAMGYKGFLGVGSIAALLPYTSIDLTEKNNHIPAADVHGGGVSQQTTGPFYSQLNVADGELVYDGAINGHVYAGANTFGTSNRTLFEKAIDASERLRGFEDSTPLHVSPGGSGFVDKGFRYPSGATITGPQATEPRAVVSTLSVTGSAGDLIDYTANIISTNRDDGVALPDVTGLVFETAGTDLGQVNPVAWHQATFVVLDSIGIAAEDVSNRVTEWNIEINNNSVPLHSFNALRTVRDIYQGEIEVTGTFTYYADQTTFQDLKRAFGGATPGIVVTLGTGGQPIILSLFLIVLDPAPIPAPDLNSIVFREVSFRALAATGKASIELS